MQFQFNELSGPALVFLVFGFGLSALILPSVFVEELKTRSPWAPFALGFLLLSLLVLLGSTSELLGFKIPGRDRLLQALLIQGGALCISSLPLLLFQGPQRPTRTLLGLWMLLGLALFLLASGFVRLVDWLLTPTMDGEGPLAAALSLELWELPAYAMCGGLVLVVFAYVFARSSTDPVKEELSGGTLEASFGGSSPGLRKISRFLAIATCLGLASYCFAFFSDAVWGTAFGNLFQPIIGVGRTSGTVLESWEFYAEWVGFALLIGVLAAGAISERSWGCLAGLGIGAALYLGLAFHFGLFTNWLGPFRAAWRAVGQLFR